MVKECVHIDTGRYYAAKVINKRMMAGREHMVCLDESQGVAQAEKDQHHGEEAQAYEDIDEKEKEHTDVSTRYGMRSQYSRRYQWATRTSSPLWTTSKP